MTARAHERVRTCAVTREVRPASALVRLGYIQGQLIFERPPVGRSAYVAIDALERVDARALGRAFKTSVNFDREVFLAQLGAFAQSKALGMPGVQRIPRARTEFEFDHG